MLTLNGSYANLTAGEAFNTGIDFVILFVESSARKDSFKLTSFSKQNNLKCFYLYSLKIKKQNHV